MLHEFLVCMVFSDSIKVTFTEQANKLNIRININHKNVFQQDKKLLTCTLYTSFEPESDTF